MENKEQLPDVGKKVTAVAFYKKQVVELAFLMQHQKIDLYEFPEGLRDFGIQAKEMEKEQTIEAIKDAHQTDFFCKYYYPEQYYETKYGTTQNPYENEELTIKQEEL